MPKKNHLIGSVALLLVATVSRAQQAGTLNFEGFSDNAVLTTQYPGLTFTNTLVLGVGISLNEFEFPPHSGANAVSDNSGAITISFATPVASFSGYFTYSVTPTVRAFNSSNAQVASATAHYSNNEALSGNSGSSPNEFLQVSSAGGIASVTISGNPAGQSFTLDDVTIVPLSAGAPKLTITKTHSGSFAQAQQGATYSAAVSNAGTGATSGTVSVSETAPVGLALASMSGTGWTCPGGATCTRSDALAAGASYPAITVLVNVASNASSPQFNAVIVSGGGSLTSSTSDSTAIGTLPSPVLTSPANGATGVSLTTSLNWSAASGATSYDVHFGASPTPPLVTSTTSTSYSPGTLSANTTYYWQIVAKSGSLSASSATFSFVTTGQTGPLSLQFVPVTPCRVADTRYPNGPFGGPSLIANSSRSFTIPSSACGIPSTAQAYSLNVTVVPHEPLGFLSIYPTGQAAPATSTLNSTDARVKADAAIVPAGTSGAVTVYSTDVTDVVLDINGYFVAPSVSTLAFYPMAPCRLVDTRYPTGSLGGPSMVANVARTFPLLSSPCGVPSTAQAYALNMTIVPYSALGYLATWPAGLSQPVVSTLNAPTAAITANAAIVPAGTSGGINALATSNSDLIIDINGYFAPAGSPGALSLYTVTPCRVLDTRNPTGPLGGPELSAGVARSFPVPTAACGVPTGASAYSFNATVVPPAPLGFLTLGNSPVPTSSTLNDLDGTIVSNAAIVPAAGDGSVYAYASDATQLILDINGYFAR